MYQKMLVPLDGSKLAEVVFTYAKELVARLGLEVIVLHVYGPGEHELIPMRWAYVEHSAEMIKHQAEEVRQKLGTHTRGKAIEARAELVEGYPAEEILDYADRNNIDVILIATHGRSGINRWTMGSVADKVVRASKVPVWLVQAGVPEEIVFDKWPNRAILVPLDGSELAEAALPHAEAIAKQHGAELIEVVLLTVCEPPDVMSAVSYHLTPDEYPPKRPLKWEEYVKREMSSRKAECGKYLAEIEKRLRDKGLKVRSEVLMGLPPAEAIIDYASKNPFNLIVMATHGRSGLSRWAYGSVTDKVLHGVSSPLLLVRPG